MGLRMNNFNILGFTEKSDFYENQYRGGIAQKGGLRQFAGLKGGGGLGKKDGIVFMRGRGIDLGQVFAHTESCSPINTIL